MPQFLMVNESPSKYQPQKPAPVGDETTDLEHNLGVQKILAEWDVRRSLILKTSKDDLRELEDSLQETLPQL